MRRNCLQCTRWRPPSDYRVTASKRGSGEYLNRTCESCERKTTREQALRRYHANHEVNKAKQRNRARERRRSAGVPERGKYAKSKQLHLSSPDRTLDLILRYGPRK